MAILPNTEKMKIAFFSSFLSGFPSPGVLFWSPFSLPSFFSTVELLKNEKGSVRELPDPSFF